jgi:uncharacterized protein
MSRPSALSIDPAEIAFDIDGVVADTMAVFVRLAHERYGLTHLTKDHLQCYNLYECLSLEREVIDDLICLTLDDEHTLQIPPMPGAPEVLTALSDHAPLRFITARIWPESITGWLTGTLSSVPSGRIDVIATGSPESKPGVLKQLGVRYFVEDRPETCRMLAEAGIKPILFEQPWNKNMQLSDLVRVSDWRQIREWVLPPDGKML